MYHQATITTQSATKPTSNHAVTTPSAERYFCANESCLSDEISARKVSSFNHVWLVTDATDNTSWLMNMETPVCPCCGANLRSTTKIQRLPC